MLERFFFIVLFVCFSIPTNNNLFIGLGGIQLKISELAMLMLPIFNYLNRKKSNIGVLPNRILINVYILLGFIFINEIIIKKIVFDQNLIEIFKGLRAGLTFFCFLMFCKDGLSYKIEKVWRILCYSIIFSFILSILIPVFGLNFLIQSDNEDFSNNFTGRIINSNASFGFIGLYLVFWDRKEWYNKGVVIKTAIWLSIFSLILTFNRTYLGLSFIFVIYSLFKTLSPKIFIRFTFLSVLFVILVSVLYNIFEPVKSQLDKRILSLFDDDTSFSEVTIQNSRLFIYEDIFTRIKEGYWIIGMPYDEPIFIREGLYTYSEDKEMFTTDISFVNILLRYGVFVLFMYFSLLYKLYSKNKSTFFKLVFIFYLLASFNIDTLFKHNSLFFLVIVLFIVNYDKKNFIYSKNKS